MNPIDRKAVIRDYKERQPPRGAFAVRCAVSDQVWVGASRNLEAAQNSLFFSLRHGQNRNRSLQQEWTTHGEAAFRYEVLETLDADVSPFEVLDRLKQQQRDWAARLMATTLLP